MNAYGRVELGGRGRLLLAAPFVLIATVVGIGLLAGRPDGDVRPSPVSSAAVAPTDATLFLGIDRCPPVPELAAGRKLVPLFGLGARLAVMLTVDLGDGWCHVGGGGSIWSASSEELGGAIGFTVAGDLPCIDRPPPTGTEIAPWARSETDIDGRDAKRIVFGPDSACHPSDVLDALGDRGGRAPSVVLTVWLVDVDGTRLALYAATSGASPTDRRALCQRVESVSIGTFPADREHGAPSDRAGHPPALSRA